MKKLVLVAMSVLFASVSFANSAPHKKSVHAFTLAPKKYANIWFDQAKRDSIVSDAAARATRDIASKKTTPPLAVSNISSTMTPQLKAFEASFLQIQTPQELDDALTKLNTEYDQYPTDLKFVAAQLIPLQTMRSIVYRMVPLFRKQRMTHSALLSFVKETAVGVHIFLPTDQWRAGFSYVTEPFTTNEVVFQDEVDLQNFMAEKVKAALEVEIDRLNKIGFSPTIVFDNQLLYGSASFQDDIARYRVVGEADNAALISGIYSSLANIDVLCAYNIDELLDLGAELGKLYGIDGFKSYFVDQITGAPSMERVETLHHAQYGSLFTKTAKGNEWMKEAYDNLQMSLAYASASWNEVKQRPMSDYWVLDPRTIAPFSRDIKTSFDNLNAALQGQPIRSAITGEVITISLDKFFHNPPDDLKVLAPVGFDDSADPLTKTVKDADGNPASIQYRNYLRGRPTAWTVTEYQKYFPDVKYNSDIEKSVRVLSQTWGGFIGVAPLMTFLDF